MRYRTRDRQQLSEQRGQLKAFVPQVTWMRKEIRKLNIKWGDNKKGGRKARAKANGEGGTPAGCIFGRSGTTGLQEGGPWSAVFQLPW